MSSKSKKAGKSFLSVLFYILILMSALVLSMCMSMRTKSGTVLSAYAEPFGEGLVSFIRGDVCFWICIAAVIVWFVLWMVTTKRFASAVRGLGVACTIAPMSMLLGELITMLLVCAFKVQTSLTPYADTLPSQFADGCGDNVIFMLSSLMIASVGVFLCKIKRLPAKEVRVSAPAETSVPETSEPQSLVASLQGVCHMCGKRNEPDVKFCGGCGAKLKQ